MNIYVFMITSMFIFCGQLLTLLAILWMAFLMIGWPIKKFARAIKHIIRRAQVS